MGFDPRQWSSVPYPSQRQRVTSNLESLLVENDALRQEVRRLRAELERLRSRQDRQHRHQSSQAVDDTMKAPPPMYDPMDDADNDDSVVEEYDQAELDYAMMERNDSGNAKRLYHRYGNDLVHVSRIGWHCWNGKYWDREEGDLEVMRRCRDVSTSIQGPEAAALYQYLMGRRDDDGNPKQVKKAANDAVIRHRKFGERSGDLAKIKAMTEISKVDLSRPPDALDKHPFMLSLGNGTITLPDPSDTSGKDQVRKRRFKRSDYISRIGNVVYDPDAECPQWRGFLNIVQPDPDIQRFLQSLLLQLHLQQGLQSQAL